MRIRTQQTRRQSGRITLNLASMIDVTFLLLIYFMVTMVMTPPEDRLSPALQTNREAQAGPNSDFQPQIVDVRVVDGEPAYQLGSRVFRDRQTLLAALRELPKTIGIFIQVHDDVSVGFAAAAIQVAHDAGFEKVTYLPAS